MEYIYACIKIIGYGIAWILATWFVTKGITAITDKGEAPPLWRKLFPFVLMIAMYMAAKFCFCISAFPNM